MLPLSDNVLLGPVISVGTNNPDYDNLVKLRSAGGILGLTALVLEPGRPVVPEGTTIKCKIVTAAIKLNPLADVTFDFKVVVSGFDTQ